MKIAVDKFQSIAHAALEIKPREFVCIVGKSDIGKSSIFRAVDGVMTNCPIAGEVRLGEKDVKVEIQEGGVSVVWEKGKTKHHYIVTKDGVTKVLEKTGGNVPDEVRALGFDLVRTQVAEYNLVMRGQHDPVFLNDDPRGTADLISKFGQLDRLSRAVDLCSIDIKRDKREIDGLEAEQQTLKKTLESYKDVDKIGEALEKLQEKLKELKGLEDLIEWVEKAISTRDVLRKGVSVLRSQDFSALPRIEIAISEASQVQNREVLIGSLVAKKFGYSQVLTVLRRKRELLKDVPEKKFSILEAVSRVTDLLHTLSFRKAQTVRGLKVSKRKLDELVHLNEVEKVFTNLEHEQIRLRDLTLYRSKIQLANGNISEWLLVLESVLAEMRVVEKEISKIKVCPLCGSKL